MVRINFIVEGQTEEGFVKNILAPYLAARGVYASVRSVETGRYSNKIYRGGISSYQKAKNDILRWLKQDSAAYVTTMFDYYALPNDFPSFSSAAAECDIYKKVDVIEKGMYSDVDNIRFVPYIQLHEFEAVLFSQIESIDKCMELYNENGKLLDLKKIEEQYQTPEHINTSVSGAPSKRLHDIYPSYDKVFLGSFIAEEVGLNMMQSKCSHFSEWIQQLLKIKAI